MEIIIENSLTMHQLEAFKVMLDEFFSTDFQVRFEGGYIFMLDA